MSHMLKAIQIIFIILGMLMLSVIGGIMGSLILPLKVLNGDSKGIQIQNPTGEDIL